MDFLNFQNLQAIYNKHIDLLLSSTGLTTLCQFNYGVTNLEVCPNCIYDVNLKKSSGKYKSGGPVPFPLGKICPYCDWVTTSPAYAKWHGENVLDGQYEVIKQKVRAKDLSTEGYPYEFGYNPFD